MKLFLFFILCFLHIQIKGQDQNSEIREKIDFFNSKILQTEKGERLQWLDSLNRIVLDKTEFKYDSIARVVIDYAIELDSLTYATSQVCDLMYYYNYVVRKPKEGVLVFESYYSTLKKSENDRDIGSLYLNAGESYQSTSNIDKAVEYYRKSIVHAKIAQYDRLEGIGNLYIGYLQSDKGLFAASSISLKNAFQIFVRQKDTFNMISAKNGLSILYSKNTFYEAAKKERDEAIEISKKSKRLFSLTSLYYNASEDAKRTGNPAKQITYLKAALKHNSYGDKRFSLQSEILITLANAYSENDSLELADSSFNKFKLINKENKSKNEKYRRQIVDAKKTISFAKGNYKDAIKYGELYLAFQKKSGSYEAIMEAEKFLSKVYGAMENSIKKDEHLVKYYRIKDSITSIQNVRSLAYYQTLYETEKQRLRIERQESSLALLNIENSAKNQWIVFGGLGFFSIFLLITLQRSKNTEKKEKKQQEQFSQSLLQSQEEERTRIARELHDSVGQQLTLIKRKSQNLEQAEITALTNNALEEVRSISRDLYPRLLKELGLKDSITQLINEYDEQIDLFFSLDIDDIDHYFNESKSLNFYRLVQECLTNIIKHAKATSVSVTIKIEDQRIHSLISDNGKGFDVAKSKKKNSIGLKTIYERIKIMKGNISVDSKLNKGTDFIFSIPLKDE
jgi:signal transduction histidine kinase